MHFTTIFAAAIAAVSTVNAMSIPNPFAEDEGPMLSKRGLIAVEGVKAGVKGSFRPYRLEINQLAKNKDMLNLYLIGLEAVQGDVYSNPLSYYAISGIHGRPYTGWNHEPSTGYPGAGYCTHASILFPTWHRPYLALYEQNLFNKIQWLIRKWPKKDQPRWNKALKNFRIPYWDWATNNGQMPNILAKDTTVEVTKWDNKVHRINNPLYSYKFRQGVNQNDFPNAPFYSWQHTLRYPTSQNPDASSQNGLVNQQLASNAASLQQRVYHILVDSAYKDYKTMSNKNANTGASDSLEAIHDVIHGLTGNGGHMSYIDYSSFDPIFWLHHANIDRIFAIWQALNPSNYVSSQTNPYGTYGEPVGTVETVRTSLTPFRQADGKFYNSNGARSTKTFGYAYPETADWKFSKTSSYEASVRTKVKALYGGANAQVATAARKKRDLDPTGNATASALNDSVNNNMYYDWKINVITNKMACGGSFFVHFFIGEPDADPKQWSFQPNLVGDYVVFTNAMIDACPMGGCSPMDLQVSGSVPLTQSLIDRVAEIGSLNPDDVNAYLQKNLQWTVSLMNDTAVPVESLALLTVSVAAAQVELATDPSEFPVFGNYTDYPLITQNKAGGINGTSSVASSLIN